MARDESMRTYICSKCKCKFTKHKDAQAMCPICGHVNSGSSSTFNHSKYYTSKNCSLNITEDIYCELVRPVRLKRVKNARNN